MTVPRFNSLEDVQWYLDRLSSVSAERTAITSFVGGWTNYGAPWEPASYTIDQNGLVKFAGLISSGTPGTLFTIPKNVAPVQWQMFTVLTDTGLYRVDVDFNGNVGVAAGSGTGFLTLSAISYYLG